MGSFFFFRVWRPWVGGSAKCAGTGLPTSTAYWRASREEGWVLLQIRPVQMARMIGKDGVVLRSSVEQAIPRERPAVAFGFEYSTMPGWGRSMWCGWSTPGGGGAGTGGSSSSSWVFGGAEGVLGGWVVRGAGGGSSTSSWVFRGAEGVLCGWVEGGAVGAASSSADAAAAASSSMVDVSRVVCSAAERRGLVISGVVSQPRPGRLP